MQVLKTALASFVVSLLVGALTTPAVRSLAWRWGLMDHALTTRKIHARPTPRLGGFAIALGFFVPLLVMGFANPVVTEHLFEAPWAAFGLIGGGLAIVALGIYDDLRGASAKTKLAVQLAVAAAMYFCGYRIDHVAAPFGTVIELGSLGLPFTMLWIAGIINALNLIDGLDGLAGGVALIATTVLFAVAARGELHLVMLFAAMAGGAVLGFLFYNFNPASIFMGDTGSMFLGLVLALLGIRANADASSVVALTVPILALGVPIADTLLAMSRRAARGVPVFSADRGHIHHRLLDRGLSQRRVALVLYGASALLGVTAFAVAIASPTRGLLLLLLVAGVAYVALRGLGFFSLSGSAAVLEVRRRNLETRAAIRRIGAALRAAESLEEVWAAARMAKRALGASAVALELHGPPATGEHAFSRGLDGADPKLFRVRYGLVADRPGEDHLVLGWTDGRSRMDRDTEIAVELLCDHLAAALDRLDGSQRADTPVSLALRLVRRAGGSRDLAPRA